MEEKVEMLEASSAAAGELAGADLESQFAALEGAPEVDSELEAMKRRLSGGASQVSLPAGDPSAADQAGVQQVKVTEVDGELEALKRSIEQG
jgi:phage shock protein A